MDGENVDLVSILVQSNTIHRVFLTIMLIGVILLTIFLIIALIRANYQSNERKTRGAIIAKAGQSLLIFLLIPFLLLAGMTLVNTIMASINSSMQIYITEGQSSIGGQMLITTGNNAFIGSSGEREAIERMFLSGELDYNKLSVVKQYYDISEMNYVVGILGGLVMLVMFVISSITFIQRIFDVILLYIVSPITTSTIPLDEGNRFRVWKDMLISKILGAYGIILVMNLFFLIMPQINRMTFFDNGFQNGLVYFLFMIGGAFAITKANLVISQLCGSQAGGREFAQMIYNFRSGLAFGKATTGAIGAVVGRAVGGSDYLKHRKQGHTKGESLNMSVHSNRNQRVMQQESKHPKADKAKQIAGAPLRLATLPVGVVKDLLQGGVITAGKNFVPRLKNVAVGNTLTNRADIKPKKPKAETTAQANQAAKKAEEVVNKTNDAQRNNDTSGGNIPPNTPPSGNDNSGGGDMSSTRETGKADVDTSAVNTTGKNTEADIGSMRETSGRTTLTPIDNGEDGNNEDNSEENKD